MPLCLIFPYGGKTEWIDFCLRNDPNIKWLIVLANTPRNIGENKRPDFYKDAKKYIEGLRDSEKKFLNKFQRRYDVLNVPHLESYSQNLSYLRSLIKIIKSKGYTEIHIHLNSGLMIYRIGLYQCAEEFRDLITKVFIIDKENWNIETIRIYRDLNEIEKQILELLVDNELISISNLQKLHEKKFEKKTLSYILKTVNRLSSEGFIDEIKDGREKMIKLSSFGKNLYHSENYYESISKDLDDNIDKKLKETI